MVNHARIEHIWLLVLKKMKSVKSKDPKLNNSNVAKKQTNVGVNAPLVCQTSTDKASVTPLAMI